ncbi:MAG: uridine kinase [Bacteroidetes bacterium]|nr:uridine kinase [Bacteroidota bacterium]
MLNDLVSINKKHEEAAAAIYDRLQTELKEKYIVTISGEVASGKCEIAQVLARLFKKDGLKVKILHMDDYYLIPPDERTQWRKKHGIDKIGYDEYDWKRINQNVDDFKADQKSSLPSVDLITSQVDEIITDFKGIDILVINGLYSIMLDKAHLKVFVELTYKETLKEQIADQKEELDAFRMKVLEREHKVVQSLKPMADFYVDFDNSLEAFHL